MLVERETTELERSLLVERYLPLARGVARRFASTAERQDDLLQVAALALVQAVDRRDPSRSAEFGTYVLRCVEGAVRRHLRDRSSPVRVPRSLQGESARAQLPASVRLVADSARRPLELVDDVAPDRSAPVEEQCLDRVLVARAARALDARERRIVLERFFLERTQAEVAASLGLSQAHVSRLLAGALVKMRRRVGRDDALSPAERTATLGGDALERPASPGA
ncbi:MAG TPA: sigma-70 family RNA polymerase sigma factor [Gaiellaceae bacterium]|jgi:RNA polymerase sigma-B factor|nr:sigma-70 family RNA polymerase sigma factor [Gaiellaceae bacterium]